jgi:hypothetical protein
MFRKPLAHLAPVGAGQRTRNEVFGQQAPAGGDNNQQAAD